jgi:uncharacterized protein YacL (UPF0231 family)
MTNRPNFTLNNTIITHNFKYSHIYFYLLIISLLVACASAPPSKTLAQSKVAVSSVDHNNYRKHLNDEVNDANSKLQRAQKLEAKKQHSSAERLAQQILVDVELIQIKTQRLNVEQEVKKIENSIAILHEELKWREPIQLTPLNR